MRGLLFANPFRGVRLKAQGHTLLILCLVCSTTASASGLVSARAEISVSRAGHGPRYISGLPKTLTSGSPAALAYDVVVVGAGPSGVSAAIQAARLGAKVALLEETDWIGGQMTAAAVTSMDEGTAFIRNSGIYREFVNKVMNYYRARGKAFGTCYFLSSSLCFEPAVGQQVLYQMIAETKNQTLPNGQTPVLDLYLRHQVTSVLKDGNTLTGLVVQNGNTFLSKIIIDATEYGDLLPLAGAKYRVGNSTSLNLSPASCIQDITYTAVVKKYPNGVPSELVIRNPPPGYAEAKPLFLRIVARSGSVWTNSTGAIPFPVNWAFHNAYRGMPDSSSPQSYTGDQAGSTLITKTGLNMANDYPGGVISPSSSDGTLRVTFLENPVARKQAACEAKLKTLQFIYFMQDELGETSWSIANDQGFDTSYNIENNSCPNIPDEFKTIEKYFPLIPYARESRRVVGLHTLTAREVRRGGTPPTAARAFPTALAMGDYGVDLHNCSSDPTLETDLETRQDIPTPNVNGNFQIPFESFVPETIDGLLVAEKNLSVSRLVGGAIRLQPSTMLIGQAAGALAAVAAQKGVQPRAVKPIQVQKVLLDAKSVLSLQNFTDIPQHHMFWGASQLAALYGIMGGYGNGFFGVNDPITRGQVAAVLVRSFRLPTDSPPPTPTFTDVPATNSFYPFIEAIFQARITSGCGGGRFCPDNNITRAEFATLLVRAMRLNANDAPAQSIFSDVPPSHWAFPYVQLLAQRGITSGCGGGQFCPNNTLSRGEAATLISREAVSR